MKKICKDCYHYKRCTDVQPFGCDAFMEKPKNPLIDPSKKPTDIKPLKCKDCKKCCIHQLQEQSFPNGAAESNWLAPCSISKTLVGIECLSEPCTYFEPRMPSMKACPFCGSDNLHILSIDDTDNPIVRCNNCGSEGPTGDNEKDAVELWNGRANEKI